MSARGAANKIIKLRPGDHVTLRSFGAVGLDNLTRYDVRIGRRTNKAEDVARIVASRIMRMASGGVKPQASTEIVAMLQWGRFACKPGDQIWIASDGIETGVISNLTALVNGKAHLPKPKSAYLRHCDVTMAGIGQAANVQLSSVHVNNLIAVWSRFMRQSGAKFTPVVNP